MSCLSLLTICLRVVIRFAMLETAYFTSKQILLRKGHTYLFCEVKKISSVFILWLYVYVCVYVCPRATANTVWARNLKFGHSTLLVTLQKRFFCFFFEFLIFTEVTAIFVFFTIYSLVIWKFAVSELIKLGQWKLVCGFLLWSTICF